jgi:hypothetical protein
MVCYTKLPKLCLFLDTSRHEHLYERLKKHVIRCDELELSGRVSSGAPMLGISQVVLCTVSMLSNPVLDEVYLLRPVERLVIDEASQIYTHEFMVSIHMQLDCIVYLYLAAYRRQIQETGTTMLLWGPKTMYDLPRVLDCMLLTLFIKYHPLEKSLYHLSHASSTSDICRRMRCS